MREKSEIIKKYSLKVKTLKKHNDLYFNYDKPQISDANYDLLKQEIIELENDYIYLK